MTRAALIVLAWATAGQAAAPPPAMLGFFDAAALNRFCTATGDQMREGRTICLSYVTGAVDQILTEQAQDAPAARTICVPSDATAADVMKAVTTYSAWSRSAKGISAASFVRYAMEQAYPCGLADSDVM